MQIKKVNENKSKYMNLLLDADPDEDIVNKYLKSGDLYVGIINNKVVCEIVITRYDEKTCELKNISTLPEYRGKGYASELIRYVFEVYKTKYEKMIVGTTENMIPFYVLNGFKNYHHTVKNFFVDNYTSPIFENGRQLIDKIYLKKDL